MSHERPVEPFSDLHVSGNHVRAVLLHDPTVEGLDMALYLDGSGSMREEYADKVSLKGGSIWWYLFGWGTPPDRVVRDNEVEPHARRMLEYLATKDRNGLLRLAYWACGQSGKEVEPIGELTGNDAAGMQFNGPKRMGDRTMLAPALLDFRDYLRDQVGKGAKQGCAVFITDGQIHDMEEVHHVSAAIAKDIVRGKAVRANFILVGVGDAIDEEQLEEIAHEEYPGIGHLWCHRVAAEIKQIPELVAVLVDENMTVAAGGTVTDDKGRVLKIYEGRLPAVLEFEIHEGTESFTLEVNGQRFTQPIPDEEEHHDEDEDEDHH